MHSYIKRFQNMFKITWRIKKETTGKGKECSKNITDSFFKNKFEQMSD